MLYAVIRGKHRAFNVDAILVFETVQAGSPFSILQRAVIDPEGLPPPEFNSPADGIVFCSTTNSVTM
jgi:hypothetical protein